MTLSFTVPGMPQGKARPRTVHNGNFSRTYTPQKTAVYENLVRLEFQRQCKGFFDKQVPLNVGIYAYFATPTSASKRKTTAMLKQAILPIRKPDTDNIAKIICDALNGLAYYDDSQITSLHVHKRFAELPRVDVYIADND